MKKLLLALFTVLSLVGNAQESKVYKIIQSEWYMYDNIKEEWRLQTQNKDVSIDLVVYKNVVNVQAKTPTLYRLDESSKRKIGTKDVVGFRYDAIECVNMEKCTVDIATMQDADIFLFSVIVKKDEYLVNLRFFAKYKE